jgi:hypothetical protein
VAPLLPHPLPLLLEVVAPLLPHPLPLLLEPVQASAAPESSAAPASELPGGVTNVQ